MFSLRSNKKAWPTLVVSLFVISACSSDKGGSKETEEWLIPTFNIADGGPGIDGIPSLENPKFDSAATVVSVEQDDLVIALRSQGQVKVYPHDIMDYHEIVNDGPASEPFSMSYCPLTRSAVAWKGTASHSDSGFGVSGLLYNSNLLLYDRETGSLWSQMLQLAVNGSRIRQTPQSIQVIETKFSTLQALYPDALVMNRDTGHARAYDSYLYDDYLDREGLIFQVVRKDTRMSSKARVIGIHEGSGAKVYQLDGFGATTQTINDQFNNQSIVVVGNSALDFAAIYSRELTDGTILSFDSIQDDLPNVMMDTEGNVWDIFGAAVSGPRAGTQLELTRSYTAMWFGWVAHFEQVDIHFNES